MYAIAFSAGLFLVPSLILAGYGWTLNRPGITDRGITSTTVGFVFAGMVFVTLWAWVLPTPVGI